MLLLPDVLQQRQTKPASADETNPSSAPRNISEKGPNLHAKGCSYLPLLPILATDCPEQGPLKNGPCHTGSVFPESQSASAPTTERPSNEHREHVAEAAAQKSDVRLAQPKPVRRYEWPLIINGVYQGEGIIPSCRIEDDESPTEPKSYTWPLIILHRARIVEDCDQEPSPDSEDASAIPAGGKEKVEVLETDDNSPDESRTWEKEIPAGR